MKVLLTKKLDAIVGIAAQALGTALEKKAEDIVEGIKGKITKRLREEPLNWNPNPKLKTMLRKKQRTTYRRGQSRPSKAYVARIARSVVRRNEETKCFTQTLLNGTSSTNSWEFKSALAGLTQGTSTTTRVGARIALVAIEYFVKIAPAVASVGGEGSMCRMVFYHNKAAAGAVPDVAQIFDTNNFYSGRNVNYATKFSLLDDITHQMVITSYNPSSGVAFSAGPALFKIIR